MMMVISFTIDRPEQPFRLSPKKTFFWTASLNFKTAKQRQRYLMLRVRADQKKY